MEYKYILTTQMAVKRSLFDCHVLKINYFIFVKKKYLCHIKNLPLFSQSQSRRFYLPNV